MDEFLKRTWHTFLFLIGGDVSLFLLMSLNPECAHNPIYRFTGFVIYCIWFVIKWAAILITSFYVGRKIYPTILEISESAWVAGKKRFLKLGEETVYPEEVPPKPTYIPVQKPNRLPTPAEIAKMEWNDKELKRQEALYFPKPPPKPRGKTQEEAIKEALDRIGYGGIGK